MMPPKGLRKIHDENNAWVSLVQASKLLGQSRQTVLLRAVKGELVAKYIAGRTVVSRESVERVMQNA